MTAGQTSTSTQSRRLARGCTGRQEDRACADPTAVPAPQPLPDPDQLIARATFPATQPQVLQAWLDGALRAPGRMADDVVPGLVRATMGILRFALPESPATRQVEVVLSWHPDQMELRIGPPAGLERGEPAVVLFQGLIAP